MKKALFSLLFAFSVLTTNANEPTKLNGLVTYTQTGPTTANLTIETGAGTESISEDEENHKVYFYIGATLYQATYGTKTATILPSGNTVYVYCCLEDINEMES